MGLETCFKRSINDARPPTLVRQPGMRGSEQVNSWYPHGSVTDEIQAEYD